MFKKILIGLFLIIGVFAVIVFMQPSEFRISRSCTINASTADVFAQVNSFFNWQAWSPWAKLDPNAKAEYEGPSEGVGAIFRWSGNDQVGVGSETIIESRPNELITIRLEFEKPYKAINTAEFKFDSQGDETIVTWSMFGKNNFVSKAMGMFMNFDKMVGGQFEEGLNNLKSVVEK